jgi:hypothetical protein
VVAENRRTHSSRAGFCLSRSGRRRSSISCADINQLPVNAGWPEAGAGLDGVIGSPQRRQRKRPECCEPAPSYFAWGCFRYFGSGPEIVAFNSPPHKPPHPCLVR